MMRPYPISMLLAVRIFAAVPAFAQSAQTDDPPANTGRQYPLLFEQRETAFGKPIADGQHSHDFAMELGFLYGVKLTPTCFSLSISRPLAIRPSDPQPIRTAHPRRKSRSAASKRTPSV